MLLSLALHLHTGTTAEPSLIKRSWDLNLALPPLISHRNEVINLHQVFFSVIDQGLVVQKVDKAIQLI